VLSPERANLFKSIQRMAARLARGDPQSDAYAIEQALEQFVNQVAQLHGGHLACSTGLGGR
jgi:hypothetical protein